MRPRTKIAEPRHYLLTIGIQKRQRKSKCSPPSSASSIRKLSSPFLAANLTPRANLYNLGLTSFDAIRVLVAVERAFKIEFQREMLNREFPASIETIAKAVQAIQQILPSRRARPRNAPSSNLAKPLPFAKRGRLSLTN